MTFGSFDGTFKKASSPSVIADALPILRAGVSTPFAPANQVPKNQTSETNRHDDAGPGAGNARVIPPGEVQESVGSTGTGETFCKKASPKDENEKVSSKTIQDEIGVINRNLRLIYGLISELQFRLDDLERKLPNKEDCEEK